MGSSSSSINSLSKHSSFCDNGDKIQITKDNGPNQIHEVKGDSSISSTTEFFIKNCPNLDKSDIKKILNRGSCEINALRTTTTKKNSSLDLSERIDNSSVIKINNNSSDKLHDTKICLELPQGKKKRNNFTITTQEIHAEGNLKELKKRFDKQEKLNEKKELIGRVNCTVKKHENKTLDESTLNSTLKEIKEHFDKDEKLIARFDNLKGFIVKNENKKQEKQKTMSTSTDVSIYENNEVLFEESAEFSEMSREDLKKVDNYKFIKDLLLAILSNNKENALKELNKLTDIVGTSQALHSLLNGEYSNLVELAETNEMKELAQMLAEQKKGFKVNRVQDRRTRVENPKSNLKYKAEQKVQATFNKAQEKK